MGKKKKLGVFVGGKVREVSQVTEAGNLHSFLVLRNMENNKMEINENLKAVLTVDPESWEVEAVERSTAGDLGKLGLGTVARVIEAYRDELEDSEILEVLRAGGVAVPEPKEEEETPEPAPAAGFEDLPAELQTVWRARESAFEEMKAEHDAIKAEKLQVVHVQRAKEEFAGIRYETEGEDGFGAALAALSLNPELEAKLLPVLRAASEQGEKGALFGQVTEGASRDPEVEAGGTAAELYNGLRDTAKEYVTRGVASDVHSAMGKVVEDFPEKYEAYEKAKNKEAAKNTFGASEDEE